MKKETTVNPPIISISSPRIPKEFNTQICGFKGILCLLIAMYHFFVRHSTLNTIFWIPNANILWGCFFITSGYYLSFFNSKRYWISKFKNTYIPYIISIFIIYMLLYATNRSGYDISLKDSLMNILCIPMITTFYNYIDGAHWYIVYLIYFYFIFWVMNLVDKYTKKRIRTKYLMLIFSIIATITMFVPEGGSLFTRGLKILFNSRLSFLTFGYFIKISEESNKIWFLTGIIPLGYLIINSYWINCFYFAILFLFLILSIQEKVLLFNIKLFQIIGESSLFIYLLHQNIGYLIISMFKNYWIGAISALICTIIFGVFISKIYSCIRRY